MWLALTLIALLLTGLPIFVCLGLTTLVFMSMSSMDTIFLAKSLYAGVDQYPLLAVTGFILVGNLFEKAGITEEIINLVKKFMGKSKSGLAVITVVSSAVFAALSGSGPATVATIGGLMVPAMVRAGYPPAFAAGVAASGGALGVLIPPSNPFLMYGIIARESIAALFLAGVVPGLLMTLALSFTSWLRTKRYPDIRVDVPEGSRNRRFWKLHAVYEAKWALCGVILLLGGIYAGFFTPIEAAEVTVFYTLVIGLFVTRKMNYRDIYHALVDTATMSGTLIILVAAATAFGRLITLYQLPQAMGAALSTVSENPIVILFIISGLMIFIGTWAETFSMIVVLTPVFLPIVQRLGVDPIHFGVIFVVCTEISFLTPPFGCNLFVAMKQANVSLEAVAKSVLPYVLAYMIVLALLIFFPALSTFLPRLVFG